MLGVLLALSLSSNAARAVDLSRPRNPPDRSIARPRAAEEFSRFYIGGAANWVHHTGYVPNQQWNVEHYAFGGKAFGGFRINPYVHVEVVCHYLGKVPFDEGFPTPSYERSYAVSGSVLLVSPSISQWIGTTHLPIHAFVRFGLAYKGITQIAFDGTLREATESGVFGAGLEYRPSSKIFVRMEYEFISSAIGGTSLSVPALNSLFNVEFGGTRRVINVMHTPLALTLGIYF
jgi:hypothetical protein